MINVNCQWIDRGVRCTNKRVKRGFLGLGTRVCIEYRSKKVCEFKSPWPRPKITPPPPPRKEQRLKEVQARECKRELIKAYTNMLDGIADEELDKESIHCGLIFLVGKSKQERIQCFTEKLNKESLKGVLARLDRIKKKLPQLF